MILYAWGNNSEGELGVDAKEDKISITPQIVQTLAHRQIHKIACGTRHSLALDEFGNVFSWGRNIEGQCGHDRQMPMLSLPQPVTIELSKYRCTVIAAGGEYSCAATACGRLFEWGRIHTVSNETDAKPLQALPLQTASNAPRVLGERERVMVEESQRLYLNEEDVDIESRRRRVYRVSTYKPTAALIPKVDVTKVAVGQAHVLALAANGNVYSKGYNDHGQLGNCTRESIEEFALVQLSIAANVAAKDVAAGNAHSAVLETNGFLWTFGNNQFGQTGQDIGFKSILSPEVVAMPLFQAFEHVAAGDFYTLAYLRTGGMVFWGHPGYAQYGSGEKPEEQERMGVGEFAFASRDAYFNNGFVVSESFGSKYDLVVGHDGFIHQFKWTGCTAEETALDRSATPAPLLHERLIKGAQHLDVRYVASGSNHTLILAERHGSLHALRYVSLLGISDGTVLTCKPSFRVASPKEIPVLSWIIFSRCPKLKAFVSQSDPDRTVVKLPLSLQDSVLKALVEYLYCDHVQSCPLNSLYDLESLGERLELPHLHFIAKSKRRRLVIETSENPVPSTFSHCMSTLLQQGLDADVSIHLGDNVQSKELQASEEVRAHLNILKLYLYFRKLVSDHFNGEARVQEEGAAIYAEDMNVARKLLRFIYSGSRKEIDHHSVLGLLAAASFHGIDDLINVCEAYLLQLEDIDANTMNHLLNISKTYNLLKLHTSLMQKAKTNA